MTACTSIFEHVQWRWALNDTPAPGLGDAALLPAARRRRRRADRHASGLAGENDAKLAQMFGQPQPCTAFCSCIPTGMRGPTCVF
jgi:hypothetical protein